MTFSVRLCQIINDHGSNVSEFARLIGVNRLTVQRWINGQKVINSENLARIAEAWTDVNLHWLLTGTSPMDGKK